MKKTICYIFITCFLGVSGYGQPVPVGMDALDYQTSPKDSLDRSGLMFSDQGAWFAYSLPSDSTDQGGFSGPFLLTERNGIWASRGSTKWGITHGDTHDTLVDWQRDFVGHYGRASDLTRTFRNSKLEVIEELVYLSGHTALKRITITNRTGRTMEVHARVYGDLFDIGLNAEHELDYVRLTSKNSPATGYTGVQGKPSIFEPAQGNGFYSLLVHSLVLERGASESLVVYESFIFPEYSWEEEFELIKKADFDSVLNARRDEKMHQLTSLLDQRRPVFFKEAYAEVLAKAQLTLQNNWRIPAGEIKHEGLFPSYHQRWFNGFWSWDSWKHAVGLSYYDTRLAKEQVKQMFDFQNDDGFVADCVFRDTLIEKHNYRDTKPPLAAWAVAKIYRKDKDLEFVREMYPKLMKYHLWWYENRDHDRDGLCEYGSTDGTLIAAKWESGMDNAIRFDDSKILQNGPGAWSLDQESVDLNAYLYAEKLYLAELREALGILETTDTLTLREQAGVLKMRIQSQFYDPEDGWFYDTNLDGDTYIKGEGSEGWTALWAKAATQEQAEAVRDKMMDPEKFYTKVPFQTMSADHERFDPLKGYWRGPNWLDQAYFGVKGLRNYGFDQEADKAVMDILNGAQGVLSPGLPIHENYHPITGEGLNAKNFSWSAAHIIMMLLKE